MEMLSRSVNMSVFGLPAHPLIVHAVVVLVPLAALSFISTGWNAAWRRVYYLPITLLAMGGAVAAFFATETGESLEEALGSAGRKVGEHPEQGETAMITAFAFGLCCVAALVVENYGPALRRRLHFNASLPLADSLALYLVICPVAALAIAAVIVAGHSGASLVWKTLG